MHKGMNLCERVRESCRHVAEQAYHIEICREAIDAVSNKFKYTSFNDHQHHQLQADPEQELYFLFMLDSLNFCFWPLHGFQYNHLATNVKDYISTRHNIQQLINITPTQVQQNVFNNADIPLLQERTSNLRELALVVTTVFDGSFVNVVKNAEKSAVKLLSILTKHFPNMQDHTIYKGKQIHLYKRAQILIGDIYGKLEGKGLGQFYDIDELTMFPDYRVPQILNYTGILKYSPQLQNIIEQQQEIPAGTPMEVEIRACSVLAVEIMREHLQKFSERKVLAIEVDWFLWELGENSLSTLPPHHRTFTIFY